MAGNAHPSPTGGEMSCPAQSNSTYPRGTSRASYNPYGCATYGYPSTGDMLVKEKANILETDFLSLARLDAVERSSDNARKDAFCQRLRCVGATWWQYNHEWTVNLGKYNDQLVMDEQIMVYGWPVGGKGVRVLKYEQADDLQDDFAKVRIAANMEEKILAMKVLGAQLVANSDEVDTVSCQIQIPYKNHRQ